MQDVVKLLTLEDELFSLVRPFSPAEFVLAKAVQCDLSRLVCRQL